MSHQALLRPWISSFRPKISPDRLVSSLLWLKFALSSLKYDLSGLNSAFKFAFSGPIMSAWTPHPQAIKRALRDLRDLKCTLDPSQDVWKFTPLFYRTSTLWGRCPALTPLLQLIALNRASGTADQCLAGPHGQGRPVPRHGRAGYRKSGARYGQGQYRGSV